MQGQVQLLPSIGITNLPNDGDSICNITPRSQGNAWVSINPGDTMADFTLYDINGIPITLSSEIKLCKEILYFQNHFL